MGFFQDVFSALASFEINFVKVLCSLFIQYSSNVAKGNYAAESEIVTGERSRNKRRNWPADMRNVSKLSSLAAVIDFSLRLLPSKRSKEQKLQSCLLSPWKFCYKSKEGKFAQSHSEGERERLKI
jgi:hypothetical protein